MKNQTTPEQLLTDQLAACLAALQDCVARANASCGNDGYDRADDLAHAAKLMKASARLTKAMARLKGVTRQEIIVTRDKGGG